MMDIKLYFFLLIFSFVKASSDLDFSRVDDETAKWIHSYGKLELMPFFIKISFQYFFKQQKF